MYDALELACPPLHDGIDAPLTLDGQLHDDQPPVLCPSAGADQDLARQPAVIVLRSTGAPPPAPPAPWSTASRCCAGPPACGTAATSAGRPGIGHHRAAVHSAVTLGCNPSVIGFRPRVRRRLEPTGWFGRNTREVIQTASTWRLTASTRDPPRSEAATSVQREPGGPQHVVFTTCSCRGRGVGKGEVERCVGQPAGQAPAGGDPL